MIRHKLCALLLCIGAAIPAHATTWHFSYTGFFDAMTGMFEPGMKIAGSFTAEDADGNGIIALSEVTQFMFDGMAFTKYHWCPGRPLGTSCNLDSFSYDLTGVLEFEATERYFLGASMVTNQWVANDHIDSVRLTDSVYTTERFLSWTPATIFSITPPPVPEPSTVAMLGAGLLALAERALRRRSRQHSPTAVR